MKHLLITALAVSAGLASAQVERVVTLEKVLDTQTTPPAVSNGGTYVPVADKFISYHPTTIRVYNGQTAAYENDLSITGISPSGTSGFHAATATKDGVIYAVEVGTVVGQSDIWRWDSVTDATPEKVYDTAERYWYAYNTTVDGNVTVGFSSPTTSGPVTFFSDTFPSSTSSFAFEELAPLASKMGLAFNEDATQVWTVADTGPYEPLYKFRNVGGVWQLDPLWSPPQGNPTRPAYEDQGGPMAYDNENDLLFVLGMQLYNKKLSVYDGTTGDLLTTASIVTDPFTPPRGGGAWIESTTEGGAVWFGARGRNATNEVNFYKWNYTVGPLSRVDDWTLF